MASKKERQIKVYSQPGYYFCNEQRPAIYLQGKWLQELGFNTGDRVAVKCSKNRIIITKSQEN